MGKGNGIGQEELQQISELMSAFEQIRMDFAIKGPPVHSLVDILPKITVSDLRDIARYSLLKNNSKLKKADLVRVLLETLPQKTQVEGKLLTLTLAEWSFFQEVLQVDEFQREDAFVDSYLSAQELGMLQSFYNDGELYFLVPDEIKEVCRSLEEEGELALIGKGISLNEYAQAAVNLYGIIPLDELVEIYNGQNESQTDIDELVQTLLDYVNDEDSDFYFWEEYLVNPGFDNFDFEAVDILAEKIEGKPRYVPEKEELLHYADDFYWEATEQREKIKDYLLSGLGLDRMEALDLLNELALMAAGEAPFQEVVEMVGESIGEFQSKAQAKRFFDLYVDMSNNSRMWSNKGYTPNELRKRADGPTLSVVAGGKQKVGRNALCLCGSGKKYKHCCGKET